MRVPIAVRLFLMVSLSMLAIAVAGLALIRWRLAVPGSRSVATANSNSIAAVDEARLLDILRDTLASRYEQRGDWTFLPDEPAVRQRWLALAAMNPASRDRAWPTLGYRLALADARGHSLAGEAPSALLIALASIDRVRRPVIVDDRTVGYLTLAKPHDADDALVIAFLIQQQRNLALLATIAAALGVLAAAIVAGGFRRPIHALVRGARRLGSGRYDTRVNVHRRDELGELAHTFNQLAARLQESEHSRRQWVVDTSHELRTPLAVLRAQVEGMQDGVRPLTRESLGVLSVQLGSLGRLVEDLHALAGADLGERNYDMRTLDLRELVLDVWNGFAERFRSAGLAATATGFDVAVPAEGDGERVRQVLGNLLENAARYTERGGEVRLTGSVEGRVVRIVMDDSPPGVPAPLLERLGERFFRVDPSRSRAAGGAGLGLALSREIVAAHAGELAFAPSPLGGLRVTLTLPRKAE